MQVTVYRVFNYDLNRRQYKLKQRIPNNINHIYINSKIQQEKGNYGGPIVFLVTVISAPEV